MKLIVLLFFINVAASFAGGYAQNISLDVKEQRLVSVMQSIKQQSNHRYFLKGRDLAGLKVSANINKQPLNKAMDAILKDLPAAWSIEDGIIVIRSAQKKIVTTKKGGPVIVQEAEVLEREIRGKVTDEDGNPLAGATVKVRQAKGGTTTDEKGDFYLAAKEGDELIISHVSFRSRIVRVGMNDFIKISLKANVSEMEDIQITGYQKIYKRESTSAISSVLASDILVPGMTSIDQALEGRIPELVLMNNSGEVGVTPRIRVRGTSTLLGNREPLWVLDGFIMHDPVNVSNDELNDPDYINIVGNAIAGINPQDIERIDVLKDASATALYGTRAANGVVVVTTKKGAIGPARISFNHTSKLTRRPRYTDRNINLMNSQERMKFGQDLTNLHYQFPNNMPLIGYEGALYRLYKGVSTYDDFQKEVNWYETVNTDWFDVLTRDAYSTDNTLSVSGGSGKLRYYGSIGYNPEQGVTIGTNTERFTSRINLDFSVKEHLKVSFSVYGNNQKKDHLSPDVRAMDYAYNTTRTLPVRNEDGTLYYYDKVAYNGMNQGNKMFKYNILNEIENSSNTYDGSSIGSNLSLRYNIVKGLEMSMSGSYTSSNTMQEQWWGEKSHYVARLKNGEADDIPRPGESGYSEMPYGGLLRTSSSRQEAYTLRSQLDYRHILGSQSEHVLTVLGGFELNGNTSQNISDENRGFVKSRGLQFIDQIDLDNFPYYKTWLNTNHRSIRYDINRQISGYATLGYSYRNYFTFNTNARVDASNKFGSRSNEKMLPVWSVSGMINLRALFFNNVSSLSDFRIRSSIGKQGNMLEDQSPNLIIKQGTVDPQYNENVSHIARYPNPNLLWEQTQQFNISMDVSFFRNRLSVSGSYYSKKTSDAFTSVKISTVNGVSGNSYIMNGGNLENKGYSISISGLPIKTRNFNWRLSTYFGGNFNEIQTNEVETYEMQDYLNGTALVGGQPVSTFYSYKFLGLNPLNGSPLFDDYIDRRHILEGKDLEQVMMMVTVNSGQREPVFTGSLANTITYKHFSVMANMTYSLGAKVRLFPMYDPIIRGVSAENNIRKEFLDRWMSPGDELYTSIPAIMSPSDPEYFNYDPHFSDVPGAASKFPKFASNAWSMYDLSDHRVVSGSYLKLSSLSIRYSFSAHTLKSLPFSNAQVSFNTINLFTIAAKELKGQDPTQAGFAKPNLSIRPIYTFQFNVSF